VSRTALGHVPVMGLGDRRPIRSLGDRIQRGAREAESDRHDQQAAKHEANAGHSTFLGVMAETDPSQDRFPMRTSPALDPFSEKVLDLAIVGTCRVRASSL
jgi:hypothetical protein